MSKPAVLIVDDAPEILNSLEQLLKREFTVFRAGDGERALEVLEARPVAVIVTDQRMPRMTGVELLKKSLNLQPDAVRILITAYADLEASIAAINEGQVTHYVSKPWEPEELKLLIRRAAERYALIQENRRLTRELEAANTELRRDNTLLRQNLEKTFRFEGLIGSGPAMLRVEALVRKVMDTPTTVLLTGETGTGKELLARAIHYSSNRSARHFVAQNCGALPDTLLESELFGHVRGAFTGAVQDKKGLFELAHRGTVFLDEIGDTSPAMQQRLLRVLQDGGIRPVGSDRMRQVDVRVIAASHKDLQEEVQSGRFREDLFYRLYVFPIALPPLRERREDIPDLARFFISKYAVRLGKTLPGITDEALERLMRFRWPGNIRELENEMERAVTMAEDGTAIRSEDLSPRFSTPFSPEDDRVPETGRDLKEEVKALEVKRIRRALSGTSGNVLKAAEELGLSRPGLHKKMKRYGIHAGDFRHE